MNKKILTSILTLTVLASTFVGVGQSASSMEMIEGQRWWTTDELYKKVDEMQALAKKECGDDFKCRKTYYKKLILDGEMATANAFSGYDILISGVFPMEQRMRMLFLGRPRLQYRNSDEQQDYINKMYIGWLDEENWETVGGDYDSLLASFQDRSESTKMHMIYEGNSIDSNVPMPDEYFDVFIGDDFDKIGRIYYILQYDDGNGSWGAFKFSDYHGVSFEKGGEYEVKIGERTGFSLWKIEKIEDGGENGDGDDYENEDEGKNENGDKNEDEGNDRGKNVGGSEEFLESENTEEVSNVLETKNGDSMVVQKILTPDTGMVKKS